MLNLLYKMLEMIAILRRKLIHSIALDHLGTDVSPLDRVDDVVGCAESVTEILNKATGFPIITGTWTLEDKLNRSKNWYRVSVPQEGDVLVSATGTSKYKKPPYRGHTAIVGRKDILMSNDSSTGKWMANYTLDTWKKRYVTKGGYKMNFYRYKI